MTLFGRTLDAEAIASLVFLLMVLVLWTGAWRQDRNWRRWFTGWESARKARREAELAGENPPPSSDQPRGPWG